MASGSITSWQIDGETMETVTDFILGHYRITADGEVGKIPWRKAWQPTRVFLPGESPWTEEPGGLQIMGVTKRQPPGP